MASLTGGPTARVVTAGGLDTRRPPSNIHAAHRFHRTVGVTQLESPRGLGRVALGLLCDNRDSCPAVLLGAASVTGVPGKDRMEPLDRWEQRQRTRRQPSTRSRGGQPGHAQTPEHLWSIAARSGTGGQERGPYGGRQHPAGQGGPPAPPDHRRHPGRAPGYPDVGLHSRGRPGTRRSTGRGLK